MGGYLVEYRLICQSVVGVFSAPQPLLPPYDPSWRDETFGKDVSCTVTMTLPGGFMVQENRKEPPHRYLQVLPDRIAVAADTPQLVGHLFRTSLLKFRKFQSDNLKGATASVRLLGINSEFEFGKTTRPSLEWLADKIVRKGLNDLPESATVQVSQIEFRVLGLDADHVYAFRLEPRSTDPQLVFVYANDQVELKDDKSVDAFIGHELESRLENAFHRAAQSLLGMAGFKDAAERKEPFDGK